jgi:F-type H+-transporting ATPase subunit delta
MKISAKQYAIILYEAIAHAKEDDYKKIINNFAKLLFEHNQVSNLNKIIYFFDQIWNEKNKIIKTQIITAHKMDDEVIGLLKEYLLKQTDGEIELSAEVDKKIKGGFILRYKDKSIDYSLQNRLRQLKTNLIK